MANLLDAFTGSTTEKVVKPIITIVLVAVLIYFITKWIQAYKTRHVGFSSGYDASQVDPNVNYDNLADAVHETFDGILGGVSGSEDEALAKRLMVLNNDELKFVNDRYAKLYGKGTRSMYKSINSAPFCIGCSNYHALLERMRNLGLG